MSNKAENIMHISGVSSGYEGRNIVKNIDMDIKPSSIYALVGQNASGKSTLMNALFGILPLHSGSISIHGTPINPSPINMLGMGVSYMPQTNNIFPNLTVKENIYISLRSSNNPEKREIELERIIGLLPVIKPLLDKHCNVLSGGEKQIVALGCALSNTPSIIFIDEPCSGLSQKLSEYILSVLHDLSKTTQTSFLIIDHKIDLLINASDWIFVMKEGEISLSSSVSDVNYEMIKKVYF